jgi:hypothetical protein
MSSPSTFGEIQDDEGGRGGKMYLKFVW